MTSSFQDVRYALRQLRKSRGFAAIAVLTLALGVGANTAIFSVVNGVLLNPLPFPNASRIVSLFQDKPNFPKGAISYPNFLDWQRDNHSFEPLAAYRWGDGSITGVGQAEDVPARRVSWTFFPILGVNPILGRNFSPDEDRRGANPTAMISGVMGLTLAVVGIYGVVAFAASQRTREIGICIALGANRTQVLKLVLRQGAWVVIAGAALGLLATLGISRGVANLLLGVSATDPLTFGSATFVLVAVALYACYVPARGAMKVDPMVVLRYE